MEHLALEIFDLGTGSTGSQYAFLESNASISITDTSELFADGDVWSHSFTLDAAANAHILGSAAEIHGSRLHDQLHKRRARLWVEGLPLYLGYLKLDSDAEVDEDGNIDVKFESGQKTFEDMLDGVNARDVPMLADHLLGVALWRERLPKVRIAYHIAAVCDNDQKSKQISGVQKYDQYGNKNGVEDETLDVDLSQYTQRLATRWPKLVVHQGTFSKATGGTVTINHADTINTDFAYDDDAPNAHPYCNVNIAYQKHDGEGNSIRGYTVHRARDVSNFGGSSTNPSIDRGVAWPNTAPCFYVMYWLRALMTKLGIYIEENQMQGVEDLRRLFLMNTLCAYDEPDTAPTGTDKLTGFDLKYKTVFVADDEGNIGGAIIADETVTKTSGGSSHSDGLLAPKDFEMKISKIEVTEKETPYGHLAYATSDCFPNKDAKDIITALEEGFGVRLLFDSDFRRVRIVLLRNIFRNKSVQTLACDITGLTKTENNVRGFLMTYGNSEDTQFSMPMFDKMLPKHQSWDNTDSEVQGNGISYDTAMQQASSQNKELYYASRYKLTKESYGDLINEASGFNKKLYYTENNGNAWAYKADSDATRYKDARPSLVEVAGFMDAVDGDCTGADDTFKTAQPNFTPLIMNDVNQQNYQSTARRQVTAANEQQQFAAFVGEDMKQSSEDYPSGYYGITDKSSSSYNSGTFGGQGRSVDDDGWEGNFKVSGDIAFSPMTKNGVYPPDGSTPSWNWSINMQVYLFETLKMELLDAFEANDDGVAPIETHDWGLTLGIMRGSGSDAYVQAFEDPDDKEDNETWELMPGKSATAHPDICDSYGREFSYTGSTTVNSNSQAIDELQKLFPDSNAPFNNSEGYITSVWVATLVTGFGGRNTKVLFVCGRSNGTMISSIEMQAYADSFNGHGKDELLGLDSRNLIVKVGATDEDGETLVNLCRLAYGSSTQQITLDNGIDSRVGRFSLKLRSEKPNPDFDAMLPENETTNRRYLPITYDNLRGRGLSDQFYKEYSYFIRNARIAKMKVRMELAQLLSIDKTKQVKVGDVQGFIRKMEYTVSNDSGLGEVTMEIMYI